jgi:hypothetical protein
MGGGLVEVPEHRIPSYSLMFQNDTVKKLFFGGGWRLK